MPQAAYIQLPNSGVAIREIPFDAPWSWLEAGWRDMWAVPRISLGYGMAFALLVIAIALGLMQAGWASLFLALCGGLVLIGPLLAAGLYEASRRLERGETVEVRDIGLAVRSARGQLGFFGVVLAFAFFVWLELAFLLLMLFMGTNAVPPLSDFVPMLLFTPHGQGLLAVGTLVGGVLAAIVYGISVISVPLLMTHRIDAVTAMSVSLEAVVENPKPMLLWAVLIAWLMAIGIATFGIGLIFAFPLVGHATWHAYRSLVIDEVSKSHDEAYGQGDPSAHQ